MVTLVAPGIAKRWKTTIPTRQAVARPSVQRRLESALRRPLTLVTAPAGWGKTHLLASWAADQPANEVAWLSLDPSDNDPQLFLRALSLALERAAPDTFGDLSALVTRPEPADVNGAFELLLDLASERAVPLTLILDDFHLITERQTLDAFDRHLGHLPPMLRIVVVTRAEPPFSLPWLRVAGALAELGPRELAFTRDEARDLFATLHDLRLSDEDVAELVARTEGWPAGLELAALALDGGGTSDAVIRSFDGPQRDVADYLLSEVIEHLPDDLHDFLLKIAVLDRFTAPLCEAVTGCADAASLLREVERRRLFLVPLDQQREWHRFHRLFGTVLRARLEQHAPELIPSLHDRAADWYLGHGLIREGIDCTLKSGNLGRATALLASHGDALITRWGEPATVLDWTGRVLRGRADRSVPPALLRNQAWSLALLGRLDEADRAVDELAARANGNGHAIVDTVTHRELDMIRARISAYRGDHAATIRFGRRALEECAATKAPMDAEIALSLAYAHMARGEVVEAKHACQTAIDVAWRHGAVLTGMHAVRYLAQAEMALGDLNAADEVIAAWRGELQRAAIAEVPAAGPLHLAAGRLLLERGNYRAADEELRLAIESGQAMSDAKILMTGYQLRAATRQGLGDPVAADELLRRSFSFFGGSFEAAMGITIAVLQGDLEAAKRWVDRGGVARCVADGPGYFEFENQALARFLVATGALAEAEAISQLRLDHAVARRHVLDAIRWRLILATVHERQDRREAARALVVDALTAAARADSRLPFLEQGEQLWPMLRRLLRNRSDGALTPELQDWLTVLVLQHAPEPNGRQAAGNGINSGAIEGPEALTEREREILAALAAGRPNRDIARELFIAEGTVKAHLSHIYGKLLARNRIEAVERARQLGLIADSPSAHPLSHPSSNLRDG